jgi:hypothetical protein
MCSSLTVTPADSLLTFFCRTLHLSPFSYAAVHPVPAAAVCYRNTPGNMQAAGLLQPSPVFVELGDGKGFLSAPGMDMPQH